MSSSTLSRFRRVNLVIFMNNLRVFGYTLKSAVRNKGLSDDKVAEKLALSTDQLRKVYCGRLILSYSQVETAARLCDIQTADLVSGNLKAYEKNFVHCMNDFSNGANREKVLDLLYDYLDILEAVKRTEAADE